MLEFVHTFQNGKMNKDLDERILPNGQYRDALNIEVETSEGSEVGTIQNIDGNLEIKNSSYNPVTGLREVWNFNYISDLINPVCIGSIRDDKTERLYWFIASDNVSAIAEYDQTTEVVKPVLVDTQNILKFSKNFLITGVNIIDGLLFWTDDQTEPKRINIDKFKSGSVDFATHTQFYGANFTLDNVTVIRKSPLAAPTLDMSSSRFGNNIPGTGITPISVTYMVTGAQNFTYVPDTVSEPSVYKSLDTYSTYLENIQADPDYYDASSIPNWDGKVVLTLPTAPIAWVAGDTIIFKGSFVDDSNETFEYAVSILIDTIVNNILTGKIQAISSDIVRSTNASGNIIPIVWEGLLNEGDPMFEYLFPRFAYRWKYADGEYSCFSPFSLVAFLGNEFKYVASDGYNIGMTNNVRKLILNNLNWGTPDVIELDILYKESHNTAVYKVQTLKRSETTDTFFQVKTEVIGAMLEANQLLRPWDNVPLKAKSQEMIGNRLVYGNYVQNYTLIDSVNITTSETLGIHPGTIVLPDVSQNPDSRMPYPSIKSIRTYQAGVVYKDALGRETPVFTNKTASHRVEKSSAWNANKLQVKLNHQPPSFATHFKIFIKETANEYYNLALDRFYFADDGNVWLSFPSSERNKVDEETYLILKKQHDNDVATQGTDRYKILAIENEAPEFIATMTKTVASSGVTLTTGTGPDYLSLSFLGPSAADNPNFANSFDSDHFLKVRVGSNTTKMYQIESGGPTASGYFVTISEPFGTDAGFLTGSTNGTQVEILLYKKQVERLPEFEGRFFVKINRDFAFDTNIIESFKALEKEYGIIDEQCFRGARAGNIFGESSNWGFYYTDPSDEGELNCANSWKLGGFGFEGNGSRISDIFRDKFNPPVNNNKYFGYVYSGLDTDSGAMLSSFTGNIFAQGGKLKVGALLRFKSNLTGKLSEVYKVEEMHYSTFPRGDKRNFIVNCDRGNQNRASGNWRLAVLIKLNKNLDVEFLPSSQGDMATLQAHLPCIQIVEEVPNNNNKLLTSTNPAIFETEPKEAIDMNIYYEASDALPISQHNNTIQLNWFNCYSYGNGVESNRIRDDYNAFIIDKGPKVSSTLDLPYAEERRANGMIFSQIFNSTAGINRLNQFIQAESITKDLYPAYGSIQKLHARDTDLIALCEDKCLKILANKDALYNADGNVNVTANNNVLGQAIPYAGEYGISKNPESFASYGFRVYFSDKNRGTIMRLSMDGLTDIGANGMADFFADNLRICKNIYGSFDEDKGIYNVTLPSLDANWQARLSPNRNTLFNIDCNPVLSQPETQTTVSFSENSDGWVSRKSFIKENGITLNNTYFTFKNGRIWQHGANPLRNNFYGIQYDSSFNVVINDGPTSVKGFKTLNYTGTQSRKYVYQYNSKWYSLDEIIANQYIPTAISLKKQGWYTNYIITDLESGIVKEFVNKENKWFNYIKPMHEKKNCKPTNILSIGNPVEVVAEDLLYNVTVRVDLTCSIP